MLKFTALFILVVLVGSCSSSSKKKGQSFTTEGHKKLYSRPDWDPTTIASNIKRLVIVGTNDFHGNLPVGLEKTKEVEDKAPLMIPVGGAPIVSSYFNILKERYGKELLFLDAGDIYQGTLISNHFKGEAVVKFYNTLGYHALTLGNHEFDYGPLALKRSTAKAREDRFGSIKKNISFSQAPFVSSNIIDLNTGELIDWDGVNHSIIKVINGVKVGIIGATTQETPWKTLKDNVRGLYFERLSKVAMEFSKQLRRNGAQVVVLTTHAGILCGYKEAQQHKVPIEVVNLDPTDQSLCDMNDELGLLLSEVSQGTLDAVVAGHTHTKIANFINDVPVIESFSYGKYLGMIELFYDTQERKVLTDKTIIHQPTKFCHFFFKESMDCNTFDKTIDHNSQVPATFLGKDVTPNKEIEKLLAPYEKKVEKMSQEELAVLDEALEFKRMEESALGNFLADAMREKLKTDVALSNSGGIRQSLEMGRINYGSLFKTMPFDNALMTLQVTGKQLKDLIRIGTSGYSSGIACLSGVNVVVDADVTEIEDWNQDGKKEEWEKNRLISVSLQNGDEILDEKYYSLATQAFVGEMGGDYYQFVTSSIPTDKKETFHTESYRDAVADYLRKFHEEKKVINSKEHPYLNEDNHRIKYK
ncbi:MAG: bifunctional metallophosphatase/5'-nucleotidase [Bacteriovoracaceae bacterium]